MALTGRKPKPAALRLLEGNREHRPIKEAVKLPPTLPKMPIAFKGRKATVWKLHVKLMSATPGWLTADNAGLLAIYVVAFVTHERLDRFIENKGGEQNYLLWCLKNKYPRYHMLDRDKAAKDINSFGAALGLQPTARGHISASDQANDKKPGYLD